jgi:hypothetical protein
MCVLTSSTSFTEIFLILSRNERDLVINVHRSSFKVASYSSRVLEKLEFSRQIFLKYSNMKFHENPSSGKEERAGMT